MQTFLDIAFVLWFLVFLGFVLSYFVYIFKSIYKKGSQ